MSQTISNSNSLPPDGSTATPGGSSTRPPKGLSTGFLSMIAPLASLKLTVVLFALSVFIVFAGTLAQRFYGIWTVVDEIFRCYFTLIELRFFVPESFGISKSIKFPFPGGFLIGGVLLINLITAHAIRFKVRAQGGRLIGGIVVLLLGIIVTGMMIRGMFARDLIATVGDTHVDAFWPVFWRLIRGGVAAFVLLIGCWLLFKKRAGMVLLHSGIIILLVSEIITGYFAVEGQMRIPEGETANYIYHTRYAELALTDRSDPEEDQVVVIPHALLEDQGLIQNDQLPVDIRIDRFMKNSDLFQVTPGSDNPATTGEGLRFLAREASEANGATTGQSVDFPAAYVTILKKGTDEVLGTHLVSLMLSFQNLAQKVILDDKTYDLDLRFKRTYKPYSIHLLDFEHDVYVGTETPKNFSSHVRIQDKDRGVDREVNIWMNNPMRYRGETFYQSSFEPGDQVTILQVVDNVGWMMPYLSCMIVGMGLTAQFGQSLLSFLKKRRAVA